MRILLIGGNGFIGRPVMTALLMIAGLPDAGLQSQVWTVQSDGWDPEPFPAANTPPGLNSVEGYPGEPLVVTRPAAVWGEPNGAWVKLLTAGSTASAVAYALPGS